MTTDVPDDSITEDESDSYEPDPIVVPYRDILDPLVGPLTRVEVGLVSADTLAWAGIDAAGSLRSGTLRLDVDVAEDQRSISIGWQVEVDETPTE